MSNPQAQMKSFSQKLVSARLTTQWQKDSQTGRDVCGNRNRKLLEEGDSLGGFHSSGRHCIV